MSENNNKESAQPNVPGKQENLIHAPTVNLPKGGGAIRGIGEKFAANPVTGTGAMTIPIATSPGRSGFGPQLSLSYNSGAGNGPFGLGWNLPLPSISRKTDKGLPKYRDTEDSDVFLLSGAEDLVPVLVDNGDAWRREPIEFRTVNKETYQILRYRPRIEGLFARIERWTHENNPEDIFWRSISKDNITTWYGKTANSRIADPSDLTRIFSWLLCECYDDKGNVILYHYAEENSDQVNTSQAHELNRSDKTRKANRYLKTIRYGNHQPYLPELKVDKPWPSPSDNNADASEHWFFEVVFDYGEHAPDEPLPNEPGKEWPCRNDPFSSYRSGFEIRTYRLCQRVLMFHHFPDDPEVKENCLVRSTDFTYSCEQDPRDAQNPIFSYLLSVTQTGYQRKDTHGYWSKSLPPVEFKYSAVPTLSQLALQPIEEIDPQSLENLPQGMDGALYQWVDLDGEGLSGILTEQAEGWFYKRNLSPIHRKAGNPQQVSACFGPLELVRQKPSLAAISNNRQQLLDLAGDGQLDLVQFQGYTPGFYERCENEGWETFKTFESLPSLDWGDYNLRFIDLTGDGHADILITEDEAFCWHPSLAEAGFGPPETVCKSLDEENGPSLVFADGTQSIYLADLSGDGLTDLVRVRNGEICYWPNLGYGRFGVKVTMDHSPWFDHDDIFDQRRIRLADIDGSGVTDIIYLAADGVHLYFNQSGNSWSDALKLNAFPAIDDLTSILVTDLLGNGTACLVWSSPLAGDNRRSMRYLDLMGGQKPHLLVSSKNNLGAETLIQYAPSTRFYLQDKQAGTAWITKLPFPVHVVEKVTITDQWRKTSFSSTYSYHHGYFDGFEREFRGFGRVEQLDVESYGRFEKGNAASPYITVDKTLYQPPVKTVTWFHTGAFLDNDRILSQFANEYFPKGFEDKITGSFRENELPQPDLQDAILTADEWREALRSCKGMMLRQEIYELDVDALEEQDKHIPVKLYTTAYHNAHIHRLQPQGTNRHAVFLVTESEAITYHYELDLTQNSLRPDPRIAHTLNLKIDEYGNVQQSVAAVYRRRWRFEDDSGLADGLDNDALSLISQVQIEPHLAYTETHYTEDFGLKLEDKQIAKDNHRLRVPCEVLTYELTGISVEDASDIASQDNPRDNLYFSLDELRKCQLSLAYPSTGSNCVDVKEILYHEIPPDTSPHKRLVEQARTLFFSENLKDPLPFGEHGRLGLVYETYRLALTGDLLDKVFIDQQGNNKLDQLIDGTASARDKLNQSAVSGYLCGQALAERFADLGNTGQYWMRSGIAGFADDAAQHFYLPECYTNPFDNPTTLVYDPFDLYIQSSTDALGNTTQVNKFDFRVLAPCEMQDINDNLSEVFFDVLGLPIALAVKGKGAEGDDLTGFGNTPAQQDLVNPSLADLTNFFTTSPYNENKARDWLANATTRFVYYFGESVDENGKLIWGQHPSCAFVVLRERHVAQLKPYEQSPLQASFEYSDSLGAVLVKKIQAEPKPGDTTLQWIASGKTVLNNKGKPVKQYEPYFSETLTRQEDGSEQPKPDHCFEEPLEVGVTLVIYYDALGRVVRTEMPDGSFSRVEFSPWHVKNYDQNDTVLEAGNGWYVAQNPLNPTQPLPTKPLTGEIRATPGQRAAWLAAQHADTPALTVLDSLGREVISIAHIRLEDENGALEFGGKKYRDEKYLTYTRLDAEGKPLWVRDARGNLVMQYITALKPTRAKDEADPAKPEEMPKGSAPCYDIAGNLLFQHSMDAGDRWMLNDAAGKPMLAWDMNETPQGTATTLENRFYTTDYDQLHRPTAQWLTIKSATRIMAERFEYQDAVSNDLNNLNGQLIKHYDPSGRIETIRRDFKGNVQEIHRTLNNAPEASLIDWQTHPADRLDSDTYVQITEHDALNRITRLYDWHLPTQNRIAIHLPHYNQRGVLEGEDLVLRATGYDPATGTRTPAIQQIQYNAKGQKTCQKLGNGTITRYDYDPDTFRLTQLRITRPAYDPQFPQYRADLKDPNVLQQLNYTYDPVGNIVEIHDDAYKPAFFANVMVEPRSRYEYDALYRLIAASGRENGNNDASPGQFDGEETVDVPVQAGNALRNYRQYYHYDSVGNILQMRHEVSSTTGGWTRNYAYAFDNPLQPASNRLWRTWQGSGDWDSTNATNKVTYAYDTHGSMLNLANVPDEFRMQWDHRDMIATINLGGGGRAYYQYDAGKQRTRKTLVRNNTSHVVEERIDLGGLEVYRKYTNGTLVEAIESIHLLDNQQRVLLVDDVLQTDNPNLDTGALYRYQYSNHLGSVSLELDGDAGIISCEEYHPYGGTAYQVMNKGIKATAKRYRYTGKKRDEESGLYYYGARYYAAWVARWISTDPERLVDGPNLYRYSLSNPVRFFDPTGAETIEKRIDKIDSPIGWFFAKTAYDIWNVASLGTLSRVEQQKNLGTAEGVADSTFTGVRMVSNTASFGLQENIYETQMKEGSGIKSIAKGVVKTGEQMLPMDEAKVVLDPNATGAEKAAAVSMGVSKVASLVALGAGVSGKNPVLTGPKGKVGVGYAKSGGPSRLGQPKQMASDLVEGAGHTGATTGPKTFSDKVLSGGKGKVRVIPDHPDTFTQDRPFEYAEGRGAALGRGGRHQSRSVVEGSAKLQHRARQLLYVRGKGTRGGRYSDHNFLPKAPVANRKVPAAPRGCACPNRSSRWGDEREEGARRAGKIAR